MKYQHDKELVKKAAGIASVQVSEIRELLLNQQPGSGDGTTDVMALASFPLDRDFIGYTHWNRQSFYDEDLVSNYITSAKTINPNAFPDEESDTKEPTPAAAPVKGWDPYDL